MKYNKLGNIGIAQQFYRICSFSFNSTVNRNTCAKNAPFIKYVLIFLYAFSPKIFSPE